MKKSPPLLILLAILATSGLPAQGPYYQREIIINMTNADFAGVSDIAFDNTNNKVSILTNVNNVFGGQGAGMFSFSSSGLSAVTSSVYYASGGDIRAQAVKYSGNKYYLLCSYQDNSTAPVKPMLMRVDAVSGLVDYARTFDVFISGVEWTVNPVDMDIDPLATGGSIYIAGTLADPASGVQQIFAARFDFSGNYGGWATHYFTNTTEEEVFNIDYYDNNSIYIGAVSWPTASSLQRTGLVLCINSSGGFVSGRRIHHFTPAASPRMRCFYVTRANAGEIIVAGSTLLGADGGGPMLLAKLDASLTMTDYSTYDQGEFFITHPPIALPTKILLTGAYNISGPEEGYVNAFFDYSTNFINGRNYPTLHSGVFHTAVSDVNAAGVVFTGADDASDLKKIYRIRANPSTAAADCSVPDPFTESTWPYYDAVVQYAAAALTGFMTNRAMDPPVGLPLLSGNPCGGPPAPGHSMEQPAAHGLVYPNPAASELTIELGETGADQVEVLDFTGKRIAVYGPTGDKRMTISMDSQAEGLYLIRVVRNGKVQTHRVMKQK